MTRRIAGATVGLFACAILNACGAPPAEPDRAAAADAETPAAVDASAKTSDAAPPPVAGASGAAVPGAPEFVTLYPGARLDGEPLYAQGPSGPGGIVSYLADATPAAVVAFHQARAEAAGLRQITTLNQGQTQGYSAGDGADGRGLLLSVVASAGEDGQTSVQLTWSGGR